MNISNKHYLEPATMIAQEHPPSVVFSTVFVVNEKNYDKTDFHSLER